MSDDDVDWAAVLAKSLKDGWHKKGGYECDVDEAELARELRRAKVSGLMQAGLLASLEPDFQMKPEYQMGYEAGRNAAARIIYEAAAAVRETIWHDK